MKKYVLVTGGTGYIGSHTLVELCKGGYDNIIVLDNMSNSSEEIIYSVKEILDNKNVKCNITLIKSDIKDEIKLNEIFNKFNIDSVIHFAGLKSVGESVVNPLEYYENNVSGTITLLKVMKKNNCKKIVFSSSATVYDETNNLPISEDFPIGNTNNPYGTSKYFIERILQDTKNSDKEFNVATLRYFNPIGANDSGLIGENPNGTPNNLMPFISDVALGKREYLSVFGGDYDTHDGTGVRDYIHVVDLAKAHVKALQYINDKGSITTNIGTGKGTSVLELIKTFEKESGISIKYKIVDKRNGDIAECYADTSYANKELNWKATKTIEDACRDTARYLLNKKNKTI